MRHRSRTDIAGQILDVAASGPIIKSKIMYKTFLSHRLLRGYLSTLIENALIRHIFAEDKYLTTEKGLKLLNRINELERLSQFYSI